MRVGLSSIGGWLSGAFGKVGQVQGVSRSL